MLLLSNIIVNILKILEIRSDFSNILCCNIVVWVGWLLSYYMNHFFFLQILDEMPVFYNLSAIEKREVLIIVLQIIRNLDDTSLVKAWQQSIARTRLFFKLLEECLVHFEVCNFYMLFPLQKHIAVSYCFRLLCSILLQIWANSFWWYTVLNITLANCHAALFDIST